MYSPRDFPDNIPHESSALAETALERGDAGLGDARGGFLLRGERKDPSQPTTYVHRLQRWYKTVVSGAFLFLLAFHFSAEEASGRHSAEILHEVRHVHGHGSGRCGGRYEWSVPSPLLSVVVGRRWADWSMWFVVGRMEGRKRMIFWRRGSDLVLWEVSQNCLWVCGSRVFVSDEALRTIRREALLGIFYR